MKIKNFALVLFASTMLVSCVEKNEKVNVTYVPAKTQMNTTSEINPPVQAAVQNDETPAVPVAQVEAETTAEATELPLPQSQTAPVQQIAVTQVQQPESQEVNQHTKNELTRQPEQENSGNGGGAIPQNAKVGECYGKVTIPGKVDEVDEKIMVEPAKTMENVTPAKYGYVEEEVVVREETVKYIEIPATYKIVEEEVIIEAERKEEITIPAIYKTVQEKVLVKPAAKVWKKGRGLVEKQGNDGEIMCLVEEPAVYDTVEKQVVVTPERKETKIIPAVKKKVEKQVVDQPARVEKQIVPAEKRKIQKKVVTASEERNKIEVPAVYKVVKKKVQASPDKTEWMPVLCDYNTSPAMVIKIQQALAQKGFYKGIADGILGDETSAAVSNFQKSLGLVSNGITMKTLEALGIN